MNLILEQNLYNPTNNKGEVVMSQRVTQFLEVTGFRNSKLISKLESKIESIINNFLVYSCY
jgi:hypothetical protein